MAKTTVNVSPELSKELKKTAQRVIAHDNLPKLSINDLIHKMNEYFKANYFEG